jgi:hypothetical protein
VRLKFFQLLFQHLFLVVLRSVAVSANSQVSNTNATTNSGPCSATGNMIDFFLGYSSCVATATKLETTVYEMGVCLSHPFWSVKTNASLIVSSCEIIYLDTNLSKINIPRLIGSSANLGGPTNLFEAVRESPTVCKLVNVSSDKCCKNKEWILGIQRECRYVWS